MKTNKNHSQLQLDQLTYYVAARYGNYARKRFSIFAFVQVFKTVKGGSFGFLKIQFIAKYQKGGPFGDTFKIFLKEFPKKKRKMRILKVS